MITYIIIFILLLIAELLYFRIADKCNIIDKPNERSSHSTIVLRGGGIIFLIGIWIWSAFFGFQYPWFLVGLTLVAGISFVDDIHSLPDSVRLVAQFAAAAMAFYSSTLDECDRFLHCDEIISVLGVSVTICLDFRTYLFDVHSVEFLSIFSINIHSFSLESVTRLFLAPMIQCVM